MEWRFACECVREVLFERGEPRGVYGHFRLWGLLVYCVLCLNTPDDKQYDLFSVVLLGLGGVEFLVLCLKIIRVLEVIIS
jgi:hypothetical protein